MNSGVGTAHGVHVPATASHLPTNQVGAHANLAATQNATTQNATSPMHMARADPSHGLCHACAVAVKHYS